MRFRIHERRAVWRAVSSSFGAYESKLLFGFLERGREKKQDKSRENELYPLTYIASGGNSFIFLFPRARPKLRARMTRSARDVTFLQTFLIFVARTRSERSPFRIHIYIYIAYRYTHIYI